MSLGIGGKVWSGVRTLAGSATDTIDSALNEQRIRLAVTGLSRAGKTVFITSLIQNLIALGNGRNTLPRIAQRLDGGDHSRLRSVALVPTGMQTVPYFDFRAKLADLTAATAGWPAPTDNIALISLVLEIERTGISQRIGSRRVRLDILDYPGEWLLDLPLLDMSYDAWSAATIARLAEAPRRECAAPFLSFVGALDPAGPADETVVQQGHRLYKRALQDLRATLGLRYLQPGRFLCPGPRGDAPFLWFFPLASAARTLPPGSTGGLLHDRFETYKREVRTTFFDTYFRAFDRQVMLVDVLGALYAGRTAFEDTAQAVHDIAVALRDGWGFWSRKSGTVTNHQHPPAGIAGRALQALAAPVTVPVAVARHAITALVGPRPVERVAFVATKSDHVPELDRQNLKLLLESLSRPAARQIEQASATVTYHVAASIRSTQDMTLHADGRAIRAVQGVLASGGPARPFSPGQIPAGPVPEYFWDAPYFELPDFRPPRIDPNGDAGIPHLALDEVLDALIGDLL